VRHTTCKDITNRHGEGPHLAWLVVSGRRWYSCHLGEVDFSCGPLKAVIPAKAGIQSEVRLIRAEQFYASRTCPMP